MAKITRSAFKAAKNTRYATNGIGAITGTVTRAHEEDTADSVVFIDDDISTNADFTVDGTKLTDRASIKTFVEANSSQAAGAANEIQINDGSNALAGGKVFIPTNGNVTLGDSGLAGANRIVTVAGSATDIDIDITPKGAGSVDLNADTTVDGVLEVTGASEIEIAGDTTITDGTNDYIFIKTDVTRQVQIKQELLIEPSASTSLLIRPFGGTAINLEALGTGTNIGFNLKAKGTSSVVCNANLLTVDKSLDGNLQLRAYNSSTDSSAGSVLRLLNDGGGRSWVQFRRQSSIWSIGIDSTDGNFKISRAANHDGSYELIISSTEVTISTGLTLTGASTIQTSTGALTIATAAGNGDIILSPHGTGNVGIGTTSPSFRLTVNDVSTGDIILSSFTNTSTASNTTKASSIVFQLSDTVGTIKRMALLKAYTDNINALTGGLIFEVRKLDISTTVEAMRITSAGNVGIGTTAPWSILSIPFNQGLSFGSGSFPFTISRSSAGNLVTTISDGYNLINARIDFVMRAGSANQNTALSITGSGNVGIGTTAPGDKLEIDGAGAGIILASPNGTRYRVTVTNVGVLMVAAV